MPSKEELRELETYTVTEHFEHEEQEFTPWLADNIEHIEKIINLPLEVEGREVPIGRYTADILAQNPEGDQEIIIENQFHRTDHDHLGKGLVYTAGKKANIFVWIAEEFTDEHISVFRWLNNRTDEKASFFGIEMSLKQIDNSPYAIEFDTVERPDGWQDRVQQDGLTETEQLQQRFWQQFKNEALERGLDHFTTRKASSGASYAIKIGHSRVYIRPTARFNSGELVPQIRFTDTEQQFAGIEQSELKEAANLAIERLGGEISAEVSPTDLSYDVSEGGYDHVRWTFDEANLYNESKWPEYHDLLIEMSVLFEELLTILFDE